MHELYLYAILGIPTWTLVDGTWAILSQLADNLPEGYDISAYLILSLTLGNLVPLIIGLTVKDSSTILKKLIYGILITGFVTGIIMALVWDKSVAFGSTSSSLPLFILFFVVGTCSSSSNVTHFTYVSKSAAHNTTALATGMGLGSMTAGILALLQGLVLRHYGFSVTLFYIVLATIYIPAVIAFSRLNRYNKYQNVNADDIASRSESNSNSGSLLEHNLGNPSTSNSTENILLLMDAKEQGGMEYTEMTFLSENWHILCLQMINACLGFGFVPALISFACGKFESAYLVLQLATGITAVIDPLSKFLTYFVRLESLWSLQIASAGLVCLAIGLVLCAALPSSFSLYKGSGGVVPIVLYVSFMALFGFTNTSIFRYFKHEVKAHFVHHAYRWSGVFCQAGALLGSLIAFIVIVTGALS